MYFVEGKLSLVEGNFRCLLFQSMQTVGKMAGQASGDDVLDLEGLGNNNSSGFGSQFRRIFITSAS